MAAAIGLFAELLARFINLLTVKIGAQVVPLSPPAGTHMPLSPADLYGMWYPTVRRALQAISKMKRSLDVRNRIIITFL